MIVGNENSFSITIFHHGLRQKKSVWINFIVNQLCDMNLIQRLLKVDMSEIHRLSDHFIILMDLFPDFPLLWIHFS